jgi:hypothetical protein
VLARAAGGGGGGGVEGTAGGGGHTAGAPGRARVVFSMERPAGPVILDKILAG